MSEREAHEQRLERPFSGPEEDVFWSLLRTGEALLGDLTGALAEQGVTPSQYDALRALQAAGTGGLRCGEVGARMVSRAPDVTRVLDRLERQGLVDRGRSEGDRRAVVARITLLGEAVLDRLAPRVASLHREHLGHLSVANLKRLGGLLRQAREGGPDEV